MPTHCVKCQAGIMECVPSLGDICISVLWLETAGKSLVPAQLMFPGTLK